MSSSSETSEQETYEIIVYKIQHRTNPENHKCYVGSTNDFKRRMRAHKNYSHSPNAPQYNYPLYKYIRANGGWEAFEMVELSIKYVENKHEQDELENNFIKMHKPELNGNRPGEARRQGGRIQYKRNHAKKQCQAKIHCACGGKTSKHHKAKHEKSQKHQTYINSVKNQPTIQSATTINNIYHIHNYNNKTQKENEHELEEATN